MNRLSWLKKIYWTNFAKPVEDRELFRTLIQNSIGTILEIGVGNGQRLRRMARLWRQCSDLERLRYIGTDEFEAAHDDRRHLRLKQAHQIASQLGLKATLVPGEVAAAIPRVAHKTGAADLIIADGSIDPRSPFEGVVGGWLQHLSHDTTIVLASAITGGKLQRVDIHSAGQFSRHAA
jgi:hypothetical protein